MAPTEGRFARP